MRILLTGGGTAGHINPAIAIARYAQQQDKNCEILFVGKKGGMESRLVPAAGFNIEYVDIEGLKRKISFSNVKTAIKLITSVSKCKKIIKDFKPDVVVGTGGYVCSPAIIAANGMKIPTLIHEQNVFPGSAIKMLSKKSTVTAISFEESRKYLLKAKNIVYTGNPVKPEITNVDYVQARNELGIDNQKYIVAFGGSLGAKKINEVVSEYISVINNNPKIRLCLATGINNYDYVLEYLKIKGIVPGKNIEIKKYIDNMDMVMNAADVVICRSGAITLSELCALGKPSILIPSPHVTNNHQEYNAKALSDNGAAIMISEKDFDAQRLCTEIESILSDESAHTKMSICAKKLSSIDATEIIYRKLKEISK